MFQRAAIPAIRAGFGYFPIPGLALVTDPHLLNPWGLSDSTSSPWWVSDNGTGLSTLYNGNTCAPVALVVTIPAAGTPPSTPTGQVFNSTAADFKISGVKSTFIFATEDGTISAWNGAQGTTAAIEVNNSGSDAVYKGLALGASGGSNFLYAANFNSGGIDVFTKVSRRLRYPDTSSTPIFPLVTPDSTSRT